MADSRTEQVREFHAQNGFPVNTPLQPLGSAAESVASDMSARAESCLGRYRSTKLDGWMRLHLILEEAAEVATALAVGDRLRLLDGLADLAYVTDGTAVAYGLPLDGAFNEVHRSNMTKERVIDDTDGDRLRRKGPHYIEPDLQRVLDDEPTVLQAIVVVAAWSQKPILDTIKNPPSAMRIDQAMGYLFEGGKVDGATIAKLSQMAKARLLGGAFA